MQKSRRRIGLACAVLIILAGAGYWWFSRTARPNILLITLDTTRADRIGTYGYKSARTPVLDQLAREGVLFERAYTVAPLTLPVHASLMTGLYPPEHGLRTNGYGSLSADRTTLCEILVREGYVAGAFVASFVLDKKFGLNQGFQEYNDDLIGAKPTQDAIHRYRDGSLVVDAALQWLGKPRSQPFFCWVHLYDPHAPYESRSAEFGDAFAKSPYDGEIAYTDQQVGRVLEFVKKHPQTIVIVVGDHGESLSEHHELQHGYTLYNNTQHVPLILRGVPDAVPGTRVATPVTLVDVLPTLLEMLKLPIPTGVSGRSFLQSLSGKAIASRNCYGGTDDPFLQNGWSPLRSLTTDRWKYIRTTKPELYDLQADPREMNNLAAANPERLQEFEKQLLDLEAGMVIGEATSVQLSESEKRVLSGLGYIGGAATSKPPPGTPTTVLVDVKDMLPFNEATQTAIDLLDQRKLPEAEVVLKKIVAESPPEHVSSRLYLGTVLEQQGRLKEAEAIYKAVLKQRPDDANALFHLGGLYAEQGRLAEAIKIFEHSIEVEPEAAQPHFNLGLARARLGDPESAQREFEDALVLDPLFPGVRSALGNVLARQGRIDDAIATYQDELKVNPKNIEAHANLATQLSGQQRLAEARPHFAEAARLAPQSAEAHFNLGVCLGLLGEPEAALTPFKEAIRLRPEQSGMRTSLGNMFLKLKRTAEAKAAYEDEIQRHPRSLEAWVNLGALLAEEKQFPEAIKHLKEAVRIAPDNVEAQFNLGSCYASQGDLEHAQQHLENVLRIVPDHPRAAAELARIRALPDKK